MKDLACFNPDLEKKIIEITEDGNALSFECAYDEALLTYGTAWALLPEPKLEWQMLSNWIAGSFYNAYFDQESYEKAKQWAVVELETRESDIDIGPWMDLGKVYYELGDHGSALEYFQKAYDFGKARAFKEEPKKYYDFFKEVSKGA